MLLFKKTFHAGLLDGTITLTFRRWEKPRVRPGGRYRCHPIGVLEVDSIALQLVGAITDEDARRAGFASRDVLVAYLAELGDVDAATNVYRVELRHAGDGDRVGIALDAALTPEDIRAIDEKLERMDRDEPWTLETLRLIQANPRMVASALAKKVDRERAPFKADVVRLKKLGLTQSFEVGYELSPRGQAYLATKKGRTRRRKS